MTSDEKIQEEIDEGVFLLKRYFEGELNDEERQHLAGWLKRSRANRELLMELRAGHSLRRRYDERRGVDVKIEFDLLVRRYPRLRRGKRPFVTWRHVAAVVAVFFLVTGGKLFLERRVDWEEVSVVQTVGNKMYALLITADGTVLPLRQGISSDDRNGLRIVDSLRLLTFASKNVCGDTIRYHRLEIPRGGEYSVVLEDGTLARLNSESCMRFPESFGDSVRMVEVVGEAYFEVARDTTRPFIVKADRLETEVLGTHFGVRVYPGEEEWTTTLAEGKVRVSLGNGQPLVLEPGQQAYVRDGRLGKHQVDVGKELAWVEGLFMFEHDELVRVTERLSRWYNVKFRFEDEKLKSYQFTGTVSRDFGIDRILDLIERMNVVKFERSGEYIVIK